MFYIYFLFYQINLILYFLVFLSFVSVLMVVFAAQVVHALLFLICAFITGSLIFLFLGVEYLGLVFMLVYIGAIAILFLFTIMLLDLKQISQYNLSFFSACSFLISVVIVSEIFLDLAVLKTIFYFLPFQMIWFSLVNKNFFENSFSVLSIVLYNDYYIYLIIISFLLLVIMLAVVILFHLYLQEGQMFINNKYLQKFQLQTKVG